MSIRVILLATILISTIGSLGAQPGDGNTGTNLDQIVGIVGNEVILRSEIEVYYQAQATILYREQTEEEALCLVMEEHLYQKLLINQAKVDSVEVSDDAVDDELDRRMRFFVEQIGSEKGLEEYYGKSIMELKDDFRDLIENQMLMQRMQAKITENIKVTPAEVKDYFNAIPKDSLPYINSEIEISHIVKTPPINEAEKERIKNKLEGFRKRIVNGDDFGLLAYMYSKDPGSAQDNGELGLVSRGDLVPEFEGVAFNLKGDEVSEIIETKYGYHIMQLIERIGDRVNVRHILLTPEVSNEDKKNAKDFLDSIQQVMLTDTLTFEEAAEKFTDDDNTRMLGGRMMNPQSGSTKFEPSQIDPMLMFTIDKLKVGQISEPVLMRTQDGKEAYRLIKLVKRTNPHIASLKQDYQKIQEAALREKKDKEVDRWIKKMKSETYIKVGPLYGDCEFANKWSGL